MDCWHFLHKTPIIHYAMLASLSQDLSQPEYIHVLINPLPVYTVVRTPKTNQNLLIIGPGTGVPLACPGSTLVRPPVLP